MFCSWDMEFSLPWWTLTLSVDRRVLDKTSNSKQLALHKSDRLFHLASFVSWEAIWIKGTNRGIYVEDHRPQGNINISLTTEKYQATRRLQTVRVYWQKALSTRLPTAGAWWPSYIAAIRSSLNGYLPFMLFYTYPGASYQKLFSFNLTMIQAN